MERDPNMVTSVVAFPDGTKAVQQTFRQTLPNGKFNFRTSTQTEAQIEASIAGLQELLALLNPPAKS